MSTPPSDFIINPDDIRTLVRDPDPAQRAIATQRICREVRARTLSESDRRRAHKVLEFIALDVAAMVRRALAITLKNSPEMPHDIAVKLIRDIDNIAVPLIECSPVLTDEDLLEVLKSRAAAKVMAITRRPSVSGSIVRAIIRFGDSEAVAGLAANDRAQLSDKAYTEMLDLAVSDDLIQESLIKRRDLPPRIVEKLLSLSGESVAQNLSLRHNIDSETALKTARNMRERATIEFSQQDWTDDKLQNYIDALNFGGKLTASVIVRAAGCGQIRFVEFALARRAGISRAKAALMIHEPGHFGLKVLTDRAGIGRLDMHILRGALAVFRDLESARLDYDRAYFQRLMIERVLTLPVEFSNNDGDYLLEKLDGLGSLEF